MIGPGTPVPSWLGTWNSGTPPPTVATELKNRLGGNGDRTVERFGETRVRTGGRVDVSVAPPRFTASSQPAATTSRMDREQEHQNLGWAFKCQKST